MSQPSAWDQAMAGSIFSADKGTPPVTAPTPDPEVEQIKAIMATGSEPRPMRNATVEERREVRSERTAPIPGNLTLAAKLATILGDPRLNDLRPEEYNKAQGYWYWSIGQVTNLTRGLFGKAGIVFIPSVRSFEMQERTTSKGGKSWLTTLMVDFTLINEDDPTDRIYASGIGQGDDPGDKGANKAFTGAVKSFLKYLLLIGEKDDAEADESTDIRYESREDENRGPRDRGGHDVDRRDDDRNTRRNNRDDDRRDDRRRDEDVVRIEPSNIEGIERGGRSTAATEAQITKVRDLTREASISLAGLADIIGRTFDIKLNLGADAATARNVIIDYLARMSADDIGRLIVELDDIASKAGQGGALDDPGYSDGYGG